MPNMGYRSSPLVVLGFVAVTAVIVVVGQVQQNQAPTLICLGERIYWMRATGAGVYKDMRAASEWLEEHELKPRTVIMDQREVATRILSSSAPLELKNKLILVSGMIFDCTQSNPPGP